jgi:integrase
LTEEHAQIYASEFRHLSPSGINRGLRTLRRAMNLALKWNILDKPMKVELAKGEVQRDRVLTAKELASYLSKCQQPWKDFVVILVEEGMRPGKVFALQWQHLLLSEDGSQTGMIQVVEGKSKAARRILPITPASQARTNRLEMPHQALLGPCGAMDCRTRLNQITQRYVHPQAETIDRVFAKAMRLQETNQKEAGKSSPQ